MKYMYENNSTRSARERWRKHVTWIMYSRSPGNFMLMDVNMSNMMECNMCRYGNSSQVHFIIVLCGSSWISNINQVFPHICYNRHRNNLDGILRPCISSPSYERLKCLTTSHLYTVRSVCLYDDDIWNTINFPLEPTQIRQGIYI